jgi:nicotinamidase-related amidase
MLRTWFSRLLLVLLGIVVALVLLEGAVRLWYGANGSERERILYLYDRATIARQTAQLVGVPYLNYTLNPAFEDINDYGYRGEAVAIPKPDGVYRIVALGGSTTYGHALTADEAYPAQLQRLLRERGETQVEVVNLGVPGYFSLDSLVNLATRGLALQPDLILIYDGVNDAAVRIFQSPDCYNAASPLFGMGIDRGIWYAGEELPASALYRLVALRLGWIPDPTVFNAQLEPTGYCPPEPQNVNPLDMLAQNPPTLFARNLRSMAALAQGAGVEVVFVTFAWDRAAVQALLDADDTLYQGQALLNAIDEQNEVVRALAVELDAGLIDLAVQMGEGAYYQGDWVHMTAVGAARQAEVIGDEVMR